MRSPQLGAALVIAATIGILTLDYTQVARAEYPSMATPQTEPGTGTVVTRPKDAVPTRDDLTAVIVTQCSLVVAVYITDKDGRLLRFDKNNAVPLSKLMERAWSAKLVERVEVTCETDEGMPGVKGYKNTEV